MPQAAVADPPHQNHLHHQPPPLWLQNWRFPSANRSAVRVLANIPAPKRFFEKWAGGREAIEGQQAEFSGATPDTHQGSPQQQTSASIAFAATLTHSPTIMDEAAGAAVDSVVSGEAASDHQSVVDPEAQDFFHRPPHYSENGAGGGHDHVMLSNSPAVLFYLYNIPVTGEKLIYASIILFIAVLLISTSVLTICTIITSATCRDVIGHYLLSLAAADLLCGTLITPLSIYAALDDAWTFDQNRYLCKFAAYLEIMLFTCTAYIFMWIGVDRYAALTRPSRYEIEQSPTRCKCWIVFTWVTSALLCCPTLFGQERQARYYSDAFMCVLDWGAVAPYSATLAVLVIAPSLISVLYTYSYIFRNLRDPEGLEDNQKALLDNDPTYAMTFFVILSFAVSWAPYFTLRAVETFSEADLRSRTLHFTLTWLAIGGSNWKFLIYCLMSSDFCDSLRDLFRRKRGKKRSDSQQQDSSNISSSNNRHNSSSRSASNTQFGKLAQKRQRFS